MAKEADRVKQTAKKLAASRGFGRKKPDPEAIAAQREAHERERMARAGFHIIDSPEEEQQLREAAERAGAELRVSSAPQRYPK